MNIERAINKTHNLFVKYYKLSTKFDSQLIKNNLYTIYINIKYDNKNKRKPVVIPETEDNMKLLSFINRRKKTFVRLHQYLLKVLMSMKKGLELKTFKRLNVNLYKKAIANKNVRQILIEYVNIYRRINYFISVRYQQDYIYTNVKKIRGQYYHKIHRHIDKSNCVDNNCIGDDRQELNNKFVTELYTKVKTKKDIKAFIKSQLFRDYYECLYSKCNKEVILYYRSHLTYIFTLISIKDKNKYKRHLNDYNKLRKALSPMKIKTFEDFLKIIRKYSIFTAMK